MSARPELQEAIDTLPPSLVEAVGESARQLGMTPAEWLSRVLSAAVQAQLKDDVAAAGEDDQASWLETVSRQDDLVPIAEVSDSQNAAGETLGSLKDELEQIRHLVQDYMRVMEPAIRPVQTLPERMQELSDLARDVRQSADAAERAANSVRPLERTLLRLASGGREEPEAGDGQRAAGFGRLFRR